MSLAAVKPAAHVAFVVFELPHIAAPFAKLE
jgi:hypothetical protein